MAPGDALASHGRQLDTVAKGPVSRLFDPSRGCRRKGLTGDDFAPFPTLRVRFGFSNDRPVDGKRLRNGHVLALVPLELGFVLHANPCDRRPGLRSVRGRIPPRALPPWQLHRAPRSALRLVGGQLGVVPSPADGHVERLLAGQIRVADGHCGRGPVHRPALKACTVAPRPGPHAGVAGRPRPVQRPFSRRKRAPPGRSYVRRNGHGMSLWNIICKRRTECR